MRARHALAAMPVILAVVTAVPLQAQDPAAQMMEAMAKAGAVTEHHTALEKLAGSWSFQMKMYMDPSAPPMETSGTFEARPVMGGRFIEGTVESQFMDQPFNGRWIVGYNNLTGEYESIWFDNMNTALPHMTGSANAAHDEFTFKGRYKDPLSGEWIETRSVMKFVSPVEIEEVMYETRDGQERRSMEIRYTKKQ